MILEEASQRLLAEGVSIQVLSHAKEFHQGSQGFFVLRIRVWVFLASSDFYVREPAIMLLALHSMISLSNAKVDNRRCVSAPLIPRRLHTSFVKWLVSDCVQAGDTQALLVQDYSHKKRKQLKDEAMPKNTCDRL